MCFMSKGDKLLKPVSGRVKEMAEYMLSCVMETVRCEAVNTLFVYKEQSIYIS